MTATKPLYETTFIINASIEDTQIESLINHTQELITTNGGEIVALNKWGRKRLAYAIEKKNNGFYVNIEFNAPGALIGRLEHAFQLDENVLRFLTIHLDKKALAARQRGAALAPAAIPVAPAAPTPAVDKEPLFPGSDAPAN